MIDPISQNRDLELGAPSITRTLRNGWETTNPNQEGLDQIDFRCKNHIKLRSEIGKLMKAEKPAFTKGRTRMKAGKTPSLLKKLPVTLSFLALLVYGLSLPARAGKPPHITRKTFTQPTEIQGYPCATGIA
jgi:hypothetical protein